jgi:hypothetical protein
MSTPVTYNARDVARILRVIRDNQALLIARRDEECERARDALPR